MNQILVPTSPGAYRWFYADLHCGEYSAVVIFMIGSLFSPRYVTAAERGAAPTEHSAVNFALYCRGQRVAWILSEYPSAIVDGDRLCIGRSSWSRRAGPQEIDIDERIAVPFGARMRARLTIDPLVPPVQPVGLGHGHAWHPLALRCHARLELPGLGLRLEGRGYHDSNFGPSPLGTALAGWRWTRVHRADRSEVLYELPGDTAIHVRAQDGEARTEFVPARSVSLRKTRWGLAIPQALPLGLESSPIRLVESSPFYARLEGEADGAHAMGEVADFRRFRSPWIRWMAHFRTRVEARA